MTGSALRTVAAALLAGVCAVPARATVVERLTLEGLVHQSQRIVMGSVIKATSGWDPAGTRVFTRYLVDVTETLKGPAAPRVEIFAWGGTVGGIGQVVLGEARPEVGDTGVFFLEPGGSGRLRVVGLAQGHWPVTTDADGRLQVSRTSSRLTLLVPGQANAAAALVPDRGVAPTPWESFRAKVLRLARAVP